MESTKPVIISREKTIVIEASERHSQSLGAASYETILNQPVEINNGDSITLAKAFVDTSKIDPDKIFLAEPVDIYWNNGLYVINQSLTTLVPSKQGPIGGMVTNNEPVVFCQSHVKSNSEMVLWTKITTRRRETVGLDWGDVPLTFQIKDENGVLRQFTRQCPKFTESNPFGRPSESWDINIIGRADYPPKTLDPFTNTWLNAGEGLSDRGMDAVGGDIFLPINDAGAASTPIDSGRFSAVINDGQFTIPAGSYAPTHLAKLITDNFAAMNTHRPTIDPVAKQHLYPFEVTSFTYAADTTLITIPPISFQSLPIPWSLSALKGWTASFTYITANVPLTYANFQSTVTDSDPTDVAGTFRISPILTPQEFPGPIYPALGGPRVILTPPEDYYDDGSAFLQYTENYNIRAVDGTPMFAFVDCSPSHSNIFTYQLGAGQGQWFGSNNVELVWDEDQKRFRFNYLHFPLTNDTAAPCVINQVTWNNNGTAYERNYASPALSTNITTASYGGIFFTALEPQVSFWQDILGFSADMIVRINQDTTSTDFNDGYTTGAGVLFPPAEYTGVTLPNINLKYGVNITEQLVVAGDITGQPPNYTGSGQAIFSATADPFDGGVTASTGRVAVPIDNVRGITANNSTLIGLQTSGFYIVDIDIGTTYNTSIGSDRDQQGYSRNIRGVIDRYYSANSYTSSQGGDINYIHYGNSISISRIKVRFNNSDGTEIKNIGDDNTIFLKISKNNQVNISPDPVNPPAKQ